MTNTPWGCFYNGAVPSTPAGGNVNIGFFAFTTANQTISSGLDRDIYYFSKTDENPVGSFTLTSGGFAPAYYTAPQTGRYVFAAAVECTLAARGALYLRCYINNIIPGTTSGYIGSSSDEASIASTITPNYSLVTWLEAGDTVQMRIFQNSGFTGSLIGCCSQIWFAGAAIYVE